MRSLEKSGGDAIPEAAIPFEFTRDALNAALDRIMVFEVRAVLDPSFSKNLSPTTIQLLECLFVLRFTRVRYERVVQVVDNVAQLTRPNLVKQEAAIDQEIILTTQSAKCLKKVG